MDNVIRVEAEASNAIDITSFSMSVTNCHAENSTYPLDVMPSTLRFPLTKDGAESRNGEDFFTPLQGNVAFDFTMALEMHRRDNMRREAFEDVSSAAEHIRDGTNNNALSQCVTSTEFKSKQIESIALLLDREAQFLKMALTTLGIFGVAIITAFVWTGWKITHKKKRRVRMVDSLPHEVNTSHFRRAVTPELSPLRPMRSTCHETLHLISVREDEKSRDVRVTSPRHWYEEFLSPRINNEANVTSTPDDDASENDLASRALFSGKKCNLSDENEDKPVEEVAQPCDESKVSLPSTIAAQQHVKNCSSVSSITENTSGNTQTSTDHALAHSMLENQNRTDTDQMLVANHSLGSNHVCSIKVEAPQEYKDTLPPTKSPFSPQSTYIDILQLAEHIETSSSPFPKQNHSAPVLVSPDEMKTLTRKIRDPILAPCHSMFLDPEEESVQCPRPTIVHEVDQSSPKGVLASVGASDEFIEGNSIAKSLSSSSVLVSLESTKASDSKENMISTESLAGLDVYEEMAGIHGKAEANNPPVSVADSLSSASLLVSIGGNGEINSIQSYLADDIQERTAPSRESNDVEDFSVEIESEQQDELREKNTVNKEKEIQVHKIKHNVIQELKNSTRFKYKKSGAASSFAAELAVVTGQKNATDFASSLAKRVAQKKECNTPVKKKSKRKVLKPVDMSPPPQSTDTEISELLSDYW